MDFVIVSLVVALCSLIQSVIGVGLLVFGTPTLLLLGYSFQETLSFVLPPSILISFLQLYESRALIPRLTFRASFNVICLPMVIIGMVLALKYPNTIDLKYPVGLALILSGVIRVTRGVRSYFEKLVFKSGKVYLFFLGFLHGFTNMGGGFLTLFACSIYKEKEISRLVIAYGYFFMGLLQLLTLVYFHPSMLNVDTILLVTIGAGIYLALGRKIFILTQEAIFHSFITITILFYGVALIF